MHPSEGSEGKRFELVRRVLDTASSVAQGIVEVFLRNVGKALTRGEIRAHAWGPGYRIGERAVDTNVKRLRRKLGEAGEAIETVRGIGYRWESTDGH